MKSEHAIIFKLCTFTLLMYRIVNLELMSQYGSDAWKLSNSVLQQMLETARKQLIDLKLVLLLIVAKIWNDNLLLTVISVVLKEI